MAMTDMASERLIICNGFKDDAYIEAVILSTKLGRNIIPVVEKFSELHLIIKHAEAYGVRPRIGVRVKLVVSAEEPHEPLSVDPENLGVEPAQGISGPADRIEGPVRNLLARALASPGRREIAVDGSLTVGVEVLEPVPSF